MIERTVAGIALQEAERNGRRYAYPMDYPNEARIEASIQLSATHDDGDVEGLKVDPELYAAQDAFMSTGTARSADFVQAMACLIDVRFTDLLEAALADAETVASFHKLGEHLQGGGNVINAVPHGPLLDIGLLHATAYVAMSRLGYAPKMGIVISHGISGRGKRFGDDLVCLADALDWACDKVWYVTPRTANVKESTYVELVPGERITAHNAVVRTDIAASLDEGGFMITAAPSATSNRVGADGVHVIEPPTLGTLRLMSHPRTLIALAAGRVLGTPSPSYALVPDFPVLAGNGEQLNAQGAALIERLAAEMNRIDAPTRYEVRDR
ncbi:MAG TPA: hypothetical protein VHV76_01015 [Mycobacteriales bacterium]|jgi:hypothetical protein|nr:hypothetical protein [Mycobacteriales bacterium]